MQSQGSAEVPSSLARRSAPDVLEHFKAGGAGWQMRIGEALERHVKEKRREYITNGRKLDSAGPGVTEGAARHVYPLDISPHFA
jgi:hypothetical protein